MSEVSVLSEDLYVNLLCTGLSQGSLELCGGTGVGLNEVFSTLDMWWIFNVLQSGVGMLKFSELLS